MIPCPREGCPNYGRQCWEHCNHCGEDVLWRPPLLDKEIAYKGPKPLNPPDGRTAHRCMRGGTKDGRFYKTEPRSVSVQKEEDNWNKRKGYMGPPPPPGVHLGVTHLWLEDKKEFAQLYKCPLCSFQNIYKDVINHHILYSDDKYHNQSGVRI